MFSRPVVVERDNMEEQSDASSSSDDCLDEWIVAALVAGAPELFDSSEDEKQKKKRRRGAEDAHTMRRSDYWNHTAWGRLMIHRDFEVEGSEEWNTFRGRFRMSPPMFRKLCDFCRVNSVFDNIYECRKVPLEFKVLAALRVLARDVCVDDVKEGSGLRRTTIIACFHKFISAFSSERILSKFIYPLKGEKLQKCFDTFEKLGFPGCIGSIDCTHVRWDRCPKELKHLCTSGKEDGPTLKFQVVVDHDRRVLHVSEAFVGTAHDQNCLQNDTFPLYVLLGEVYKDVIFTTKEEGRYKQTWEGVYFLSDQGYSKQRAFMDPTSVCFSHAERLFSEWIEAVRKDVECFFGILKARFRFLKNAVRYGSLKAINDAFRTCCVLHNMLLEYNLDQTINWAGIHPDQKFAENDTYAENTEDTAEETEEETKLEEMEEMFTEDDPVVSPVTGQDSGEEFLVTSHNKFDSDQYYELKTSLRKHFIYQWNRRLIRWPRKSTRKRKPGWLQVVEERAILDSFFNFEVKESTLRAWNPIDNKWNLKIGKGLFTLVPLKQGDEIIRFNGKYISLHEMLEIKRRANVSDEWRYILTVTPNLLYLNCYEKYLQGLCYASYANDNRCCNYVGTLNAVHANAEVIIEPLTKRVFLRARRTIDAGDEILWNYGSEFLPSQSSSDSSYTTSQLTDSTYTPNTA